MNFLPKALWEIYWFWEWLGKLFQIQSQNWYGNRTRDSYDFIFKHIRNGWGSPFSTSIVWCEDKLISYDWTIYYLRKKAFPLQDRKRRISMALLNFNQKRGYYQLRGEEEEDNPNKLVRVSLIKSYWGNCRWASKRQTWYLV